MDYMGTEPVLSVPSTVECHRCQNKCETHSAETDHEYIHFICEACETHENEFGRLFDESFCQSCFVSLCDACDEFYIINNQKFCSYQCAFQCDYCNQVFVSTYNMCSAQRCHEGQTTCSSCLEQHYCRNKKCQTRELCRHCNEKDFETSHDNEYCLNCITYITKPLLHFTWKIVKDTMDKELSEHLPKDLKTIVLSYFDHHSVLDYIEDHLV